MISRHGCTAVWGMKDVGGSGKAPDGYPFCVTQCEHRPRHALAARVSVLVSVVFVCWRPSASDWSLRKRERRHGDQPVSPFADLEDGLGANPRGFESRILR